MKNATKIGISLGLAAFLLAMAIVNSGCAGDDEVIPPDEPTDPVEPVEPDFPAVEPVPVEPVKPVDCAVGAFEEIGLAEYPALAGSVDGFALAFRDLPAGDATVMMIGRDGAPTGPANILPASDVNPFIGLTATPDGYAVTTGSIEGIIRPNLFRMSQSGTIESSVMNLQSYLGMLVDHGETKLRAFWISPISHLMFGTLSSDGTASDVVSSSGINEFPAYWWNGFAAHDDSTLMAFEKQAPIENGYHREFWLVSTSDAGFTELLIESYDQTPSDGALVWVRRNTATDDGYAVLWNRYRWGAVTEHRSFLTFVGENGEFRGTIEMPDYSADLVWNAATKGFGLVRVALTSEGNHIAFDRLDRNGQMIETEVVPAGGDTDSRLIVAASGDDYAVAVVTGDEPNTILKFANVTCQ